jgi:hypothetical protein
VVEKAVGERRFAMANHFTQKPILKRIKMMKKKNLNRWNGVKLILFVPVVLLLLQAFAQPEMIPKSMEIIPEVFQDDLSSKWLEKWTFENIGNGFFQPEMKSSVLAQKSNNKLTILMNRKNEFLIESERAKKEDVKNIVQSFLKGKIPNGKQGADFVETEISLIGKVNINQGVIIFQHDLETSKEAINSTLKSIGEAFLEARQQKAKEFFNESYFSLSKEKREAIDLAVPVWFSVEKPKTLKKTAPTPPPPPKFVLKLYKDKVTLWNEVISLDEVSTRANEYIKKVDKNAIIRIEAEKDISEERKNELKEELRKAGALNINFTEMK